MRLSIDSLYDKANKQIANNDLGNALLTLKKICKHQKNNIEAHIGLGNIAGKLGRYKEAETAFRSAAKLQAMKGPALISLAQALEAQGEYTQAINILNKYHKNDTTNHDISLNIGVLYGKLNDFNNSIKYINEYIEKNDTNPFAYHCLASAYEALNENSFAAQFYNKALSLSPESAQIHNNYASLMQKLGEWDNALAHYQTAINISPNYAIAHHNIATLYLLQGKPKPSREHYSAAINIDNNYVEAIVGLGKTYALDNLYNDALSSYNRAIQINDQYAEAYSNMALSYMAMNDYDKAINAYNTALKIEPDNIEIQCNLVLLLERKGDFDEAIEKIMPLVDKDPENTYIAKAFGEVSKKLNKQSIAIKNIIIAANCKAIGAINKSELYFLAGKLSDNICNYDEAFHYYKLANELQPYNFDRERANLSLKLITTLYTHKEIEKLKNSSNYSHSPIFIIGMPRSGTTLVESIISSHPEVYGAGELHHINGIASDIVKYFPSDLTDMKLSDLVDRNSIIEHAKSYIQLSGSAANAAKFVTDKMPHNFQHVGLIKTMFPNAKIIHCERNPIDTCLSIYFNNFNSSHTYATDLDELAEYYLSFYKKIIHHWQSIFDDSFLNIGYEELVNNQEDVSKQMIKYCGLEWSDNCLKFYNSKRNISTFSYDQVRKPIYNKSVNRWKNYEPHIGSILEAFNLQNQDGSLLSR